MQVLSDTTPRGGGSAKKRRLSDAEYVFIDQDQKHEQTFAFAGLDEAPASTRTVDSAYTSDDDPFSLADIVKSLPSSPTSPSGCCRGVTIARRRDRPACLRDEEHAVCAAAQGRCNEWANRLCAQKYISSGASMGAHIPKKPSPSHVAAQATPERYLLCNEIGSGMDGVVWRALDNERGVEVAVKTLFKNRQCHEVAAMEACSGHPNVLSLLATYKQEGRTALVTELQKCDLLTHIQTRGPLSEDKARGHATALLSALSALHQAGYCHRDVKCENILLDHSGDLVLSDFGCAAPLQKEDGTLSSTSVAGTPAYMPPEVVCVAEGVPVECCGKAGDVYSTGVVLYAMVAGEFPFEVASEECQRYQQFLQGDNDWPPHFSTPLISLLRGMLSQAPNRLSMAEVQSHPWLIGN